ncbi:MAG: VOC family protein [Acidobacteriota bacterium]|nr:VOC family protein [Acidobacteriota bacterium]
MKENVCGGIMNVETKLVKASLHSITPLIPAGSDLAKALAFYTEHMGFSVIWQGGNMAGIKRDDISFNLVKNDNREWIENTSFSIGVSDLEALYQEYRHIPAKVGALETKSWGRREFHIIAHGVAFQFYQREAA